MQGILNNRLQQRKSAIAAGFVGALQKSNDDELSKSNRSQQQFYNQRFANHINKKNSKGEGSKGGKIIGHTKSGKPIYEHFEHGHKDFTAEEHQYAAKLHANRTQGVADTEDKIRHENKQERSHRRAAEKMNKNE